MWLHLGSHVQFLEHIQLLHPLCCFCHRKCPSSVYFTPHPPTLPNLA